MKFKDSNPIYIQIAERICDEMLQGVYTEGGRIPSVREYAAAVEVNANTVVRSYDALQNEGIIYNKRGIGYFVSEDAVERIRSMRRSTFMNEELPTLFGRMDSLGIGMQELGMLYEKWRSNHPCAQ